MQRERNRVLREHIGLVRYCQPYFAYGALLGQQRRTWLTPNIINDSQLCQNCTNSLTPSIDLIPRLNSGYALESTSSWGNPEEIYLSPERLPSAHVPAEPKAAYMLSASRLRRLPFVEAANRRSHLTASRRNNVYRIGLQHVSALRRNHYSIVVQ